MIGQLQIKLFLLVICMIFWCKTSDVTAHTYHPYIFQLDIIAAHWVMYANKLDKDRECKVQNIEGMTCDTLSYLGGTMVSIIIYLFI